jgi:hypothetical protein
VTSRTGTASALLLLTCLTSGCGATPDPEEKTESTGTSSESLIMGEAPFSYLVCVASRFCHLETLAGPPAPPPYPSDVWTSCPGGSLSSTPGVEPPPELSGCTYGMAIDGTDVLFVCPASMALPSTGVYWPAAPGMDNGCIGDITNSSWKYVGQYNGGTPGNCGSLCTTRGLWP